MARSRLSKVRELFGRVVHAAHSDARRLLVDADADDSEVRRRVESLVEADGQAESVLRSLDRPFEADNRSESIGPFELRRPIGGGGMGMVYEAHDARLDRTVAVKILRRAIAYDPAARQRFQIEARAASRLAHRNICTIYEFGETKEGEFYLVMPRYQGRTLRERLVDGPAPVDEVVAVALQVAQGLAQAHSQGVVHRDIKPGNILLTEEGDVIVLDFGLARMANTSHITSEGATLGTVAYMSPEQVAGEEVGVASDHWALGAVMYEMLAGVPPFRGDHEQALIYNILNRKPEPLSAVCDDVPEDLHRLVMRLLKKDAKHREQNPLQALDRLAREMATPELSELQRSYRAQARRRRVGRLVAGAGLAAVLISIGVWMLMAVASETPSPPSFDGRVQVLPFEVHGSAELAHLGAGVVPLLQARIDGMGKLDAVGESEIGADAVVRIEGDVFVEGETMSVIANVHLGDSVVTLSESRIEGTEALPTGLDALSLSVLGEILEFSGDPEGAAAARSTNVLPALRAHMAGRRATAEGRSNQGVDLQIEAVTLDSTFALGWYRLGLAMLAFATSHELDVGPEMDERIEALQLSGLRIGRTGSRSTHSLGQVRRYARLAAQRHAHRLPDRYRLLIEADNSSPAEALKIYRLLCERFPDDPEYLYRRGGMIAKVEGRIPGAWQDLALAAHLDSADSRPLARLMNIATWTRDTAAVDTLLPEYTRRGNALIDARSHGDRVLTAVLNASAGDLETALAPFEQTDMGQLYWASQSLASLGRCDAAVRVAEILTRRHEWHVEYGLNLIAKCSAARGRLSEALRMMLDTEYAFGDWLDGMVAMVTLFRFHIEASEVEFLQSQIDNWDFDHRPPRFVARYKTRGAALKAFYRSIVEVTRGTARPEAALAALEKGDAFERGLANTIRAYDAAGRGDFEAATGHMDAGGATLQYPYDRWLRSEIYLRSGAYQEALQQYTIMLLTGTTYMTDWLDSILILRIAECHEGLGNARMAREYYRRFLQYWVDAEPAYQHLARRAEWRLKALDNAERLES